jgi:hypothetical protein
MPGPTDSIALAREIVVTSHGFSIPVLRVGPGEARKRALPNSTYKSLTATAKAARSTDQEVNGWGFFGLTKRTNSE